MLVSQMGADINLTVHNTMWTACNCSVPLSSHACPGKAAIFFISPFLCAHLLFPLAPFSSFLTALMPLGILTKWKYLLRTVVQNTACTFPQLLEAGGLWGDLEAFLPAATPWPTGAVTPGRSLQRQQDSVPTVPCTLGREHGAGRPHPNRALWLHGV